MRGIATAASARAAAQTARGRAAPRRAGTEQPERASAVEPGLALGVRAGFPGTDQLAGPLDLFPHVPQQHAADHILAHVEQHALLERLLPDGVHIETGIDVADRFPAQVEE